MKDIQQLIKKNSQQGRYEDIFPKTFIDAVEDRESGNNLTEILSGFNMYFLSYNGSRELTRLQVPLSLRKTGLWITYVLYDKTVVTEWYAGEAIDDTSFSNDSNWRDGTNSLVGDISISSDGYWVINGEVTNIKAQGEAGITPILRVGSNNHLQVSYTNGSSYVDVSSNPVFTQFRVSNNKLQQSTDLGESWSNISEELAYKFRESGNKIQMSKDLGNTWEDVSDYIAAWFRFTGTTGSSQADNVGKIQISRDNGATWSDLSGEFTNSLHIKGYVATVGALPSTAVQGDIYGVGPTYDPSDTEQTNPIYQLYVKDSTGWVNNGRFTSIAAGVVQETGNSETKVMSQKAVTDEIAQLKGSVIGTINLLQLNSSVWETGAISSSTGLDDNINPLPRLRTIDYFPIESNHDYNVSIQSDHKIVILLYGPNREYIGPAVSATWITSNLSFKTPNNAVYYRGVISRANDSPLNTYALANVRIKLAVGLMPTDFSEAPEDVNRRMDYATPPTIRKDMFTEKITIKSESGEELPASTRLTSGYIMNLKGISNVSKDYNFVFRYYNENLEFEEGDSNWREGSGVASNFPFARIVFRLKSEEDFNAQNTEYLLNSINIHADDKYLRDEIINFTGFGPTAAEAGAFNNLDIYFNTGAHYYLQLRQIINGTARSLPLSETIFYQVNGQLLRYSLEKGFLLQGKPLIFRYNGVIDEIGRYHMASISQTATDYIEINDNPIYFNLIVKDTNNAVSFYDKSKNYLSGVKGLATNSNDLKIYHYKKDGIIPPMLAKYARFCRYKSDFLFNQGMGNGNYIYQKDNKYLNDEIPAIPTSQSELRDDIPENIGVYNTIRKAKQMTDIKFTPKNPIKYNYGTYNAGTTYTGLIYSSTKEINTYIGRNVSFHTFMTAINNPRSLIYTEEIDKDPYHGVNSRAYYGVVCSTFVAYCWGIDVDYRTYDFVLADFTETVKDQSAYGLKLGDGIWNPGHIIIVTGIRRTNKGLIERIELCEATQTGCRKFYINSTEEFDAWMKTDGGRVIYRNTELYSNRDYTPETDFVAVEDELITPFVYNDLICCNKGDKANYRVGEKVILNIVEGYSNLEIYKDDVLLNTVALTDMVDIEFSDLAYGSYKARITRADEISDFTYWEVVDTTVTLDKVNNRVYFSSLNSAPQYFEFCNISGFRPEDYSKIDTHIFTEEEISQGYIEVEVPSTIPDTDGRTYTFAKVHFKNSYGVIINEPINWYE